jgi:carbamoylphosphate synthase large subunit
MLKTFHFTDEQMDSIYEFIYVAQDVAESREEKTKLQEILKSIDRQTDYSLTNTIKEFAIKIPGFAGSDFVYAESEEKAILKWADDNELIVTQIEKDS